MLNAHKSYGIDYCNSFFFFISFKWIVQFNFRCSVVCLLPSKPGTINKICCDGRLYCHVIALRRRCRGTLKHSLFFYQTEFHCGFVAFCISFIHKRDLATDFHCCWFSIDFFVDYLDCVVFSLLAGCFFWIFLHLHMIVFRRSERIATDKTKQCAPASIKRDRARMEEEEKRMRQSKQREREK